MKLTEQFYDHIRADIVRAKDEYLGITGIVIAETMMPLLISDGYAGYGSLGPQFITPWDEFDLVLLDEMPPWEWLVLAVNNRITFDPNMPGMPWIKSDKTIDAKSFGTYKSYGTFTGTLDTTSGTFTGLKSYLSGTYLDNATTSEFTNKFTNNDLNISFTAKIDDTYMKDLLKEMKKSLSAKGLSIGKKQR